MERERCRIRGLGGGRKDCDRNDRESDDQCQMHRKQPLAPGHKSVFGKGQDRSRARVKSAATPLRFHSSVLISNRATVT